MHMLKARVMPCLLLRNAGLVKTIKFANPKYVGDPVNTVRIYNEKEVDEIIVLDIFASKERRPPPFELLTELANECFMPMCYGGGITNNMQIERLIGLGIEKVALNTIVFDDPAVVTQAARDFGSQAIVGCLDAKSGWFHGPRVYQHRKKKLSSTDPVAHAKYLESLGVGEILVYSVDRDGTFGGFDVKLVQAVSSAVSVPVIACGGASAIDDFAKVVSEGGASAVAAGAMFVYQGANRAVLVNFPPRKDLHQALSRRH